MTDNTQRRDDEAAPQETLVDQAILDAYVIEERRFETAAMDVHLPFLEVKLYRKYFVHHKTVSRLENLKTVVAAMQQHRFLTLRVLKLIHEREAIVRDIRKQSDEFSAKRASTLDVQTQVLQLLYAHQQATARVVEAIQAWRGGLTRPYPFHWNGVDYFKHILDDCEYLDACGLRTILPLRVAQFPLCSNITSLNLFAPGAADGPAKPQGEHKSPPPVATRPSAERPASARTRASPQSSKPPAAGDKHSNRLRDLEAMIFEEGPLQAKLMRELAAISAAGYFVPLLNLQSIIPSCTTGIRISNRQWTKQLNDAIRDVVTADAASSPARTVQHQPLDDDDDDMQTPQSSRSAASTKSKGTEDARSATPSPTRHAAKGDEPSPKSPEVSPEARTAKGKDDDEFESDDE